MFENDRERTIKVSIEIYVVNRLHFYTCFSFTLTLLLGTYTLYVNIYIYSNEIFYERNKYFYYGFQYYFHEIKTTYDIYLIYFLILTKERTRNDDDFYMCIFVLYTEIDTIVQVSLLRFAYF